MVDKDDDKAYSRAPTVDDLVYLCSLLNKARVKYIVIGGFAVIYHGYTRGTEDIDLLVDASEKNVQKLKKSLLGLPDGASKDIRTTDLEDYTVVRIADEFVVDLLANACEIDYEKAQSHIEYKEINGVRIPFADVDILIKMKRGVRPKDKQDRLFLKEKLKQMNLDENEK